MIFTPLYIGSQQVVGLEKSEECRTRGESERAMPVDAQ